MKIGCSPNGCPLNCNTHTHTHTLTLTPALGVQKVYVGCVVPSHQDRMDLRLLGGSDIQPGTAAERDLLTTQWEEDTGQAQSSRKNNTIATGVSCGVNN